MMHMRGTLLGATAVRGRQTIRRALTLSAYWSGGNTVFENVPTTGDSAVDTDNNDITNFTIDEAEKATLLADGAYFETLPDMIDLGDGQVEVDIGTPIVAGDPDLAEVSWSIANSDGLILFDSEEDTNPLTPETGIGIITLTVTASGEFGSVSDSGATYDTTTLSSGEWAVSWGDAQATLTSAGETPSTFTSITSGDGELTAVAAVPVVDTATISPASGDVGDTFTAGYTLSGGPADTVTYQWELDGVAISGATASTYTTDTAGALTVVVTATNTTGSDSLESSAVTVAEVVTDTTPDAFDFTDQTDATLSTVYTSAWVQITGTDAAAAASISGGEYRLADDGSGTNATAWGSASGTHSPGQWAQVRGTSSASNETAVNVSLTIGGVTGTYSITTVASPDPLTYDGLLPATLTVDDLPYQLSQHISGEGTPVYSVSSGTLPGDVALNSSTGEVTGTTITGTTAITFSVDNGSGTPVTMSTSFEEAAAAFDPEAGLTLTTTFADAADISSTDVTRDADAVFAVDVDFTEGATGVIFEHGGSGIGAYVGVDSTTGDLKFRFGDGAEIIPTPGTTSFIVASADKPTGAGTLVWEFDFESGVGGSIRAWWDGTLLTGTLSAQNNETVWSGTDNGSVFQQGGSQIAYSETATAWTGGKNSGLRYYQNQLVST